MTFGLKRLTAILALTFKTDDATVKAEKVKSVALTAAGKTIAAKSFDITLDDQSGALNTDGQSETITLSYEAGSEPAAASFKAYFNVPLPLRHSNGLTTPPSSRRRSRKV